MHMFTKAALMMVIAITLGAPRAHASNDRVSFGKDVNIAEGETANDVVCIACTVDLRGNVRGDIVTILGSVRGEGSRDISGDIVTIGGDVALPEGSTLAGDLVVIGGDLNLGPEATIHGDRTVFPGRAWLLLPFAPLLFLFGVVWLAIWLIRRNRYRFPMYPYGRGL